MPRCNNVLFSRCQQCKQTYLLLWHRADSRGEWHRADSRGEWHRADSRGEWHRADSRGEWNGSGAESLICEFLIPALHITPSQLHIKQPYQVRHWHLLC
uniref:Uncharacterized protein n=1 Tax=Hucho hucho TaxID=62062 RepID=A0A4W5R893_9TELE